MSKCNCGERISKLEAALNELADKQSAWAIIAADIASKALTPTNTDNPYRCPDCDAECIDGVVHYCWVANTAAKLT